MSDLGKTNVQWTKFLGRELGSTMLAPLRDLVEMRDKFRRTRTQVVNINDFNGNITAISLSGVDEDSNTTAEGRLYVRLVANGGDWDVNIYTAAGASGLVTSISALADGATGALTADNSSGLTGSVTLQATVVAEIDDVHQLLVVRDYRARLRTVYVEDGTDEDDPFVRDACEQGYDAVVASLDAAIGSVAGIIQGWGIARTSANPTPRGNDYLEVNSTSLISDVPSSDGNGNVIRKRTGLFEIAKSAMEDETTGSTQTVIKNVFAAGAGSFDGNNDGLGALASHTPGEACAASRWTFTCVRGADTGHLGTEEFSASVAFTDEGDERSLTATGLRVKKLWSGPLQFGAVTLTRTYTKTGDGSNNIFTAASAATVTGESNDFTDDGTIYWKTEANASNWDISFYSASSLATNTLIAKATNIATSAVFSATVQNSSGMQVDWQLGGTESATNGSFLLNPFRVENANGVADKFTVVVSTTSEGLIQTLLSELYSGGAELHSATSGAETIGDEYAKQGTFVPFAVLDN